MSVNRRSERLAASPALVSGSRLKCHLRLRCRDERRHYGVPDMCRYLARSGPASAWPVPGVARSPSWTPRRSSAFGEAQERRQWDAPGRHFSRRHGYSLATYSRARRSNTWPVTIRLRTDADLDACEQVAQAVHLLGGYPAYLRNMRSFLVSTDALYAWVIAEGEQIVSHVAAHRRSFAAVMATGSAALGLTPERLRVVARLVVDPGQRGKGFGRALLATASRALRAQGLWPVLDVATQYRNAIGLYESCGWACAGPVVFLAPDGREFNELVYVPPSDDETTPAPGTGATA